MSEEPSLPAVPAELTRLNTVLSHKDTVLDTAMAVGLWSAGVCWIVPMMGSMMASAMVVNSDRTEWLNRLYCWGQVRLTGAKFRSVVHPDIDPNQVYLFACHHVNILDHVTMYRATPHFKQGIELAAHFKIPVYGWFMKQRGTIGVIKGARKTEQLRMDIAAEMEKNHSILGFPEGTRTRDGRVGRFRSGLFYLARDLNLPVIPTAVTGMFEVKRAGDWKLRRGREVTVYCDAPMDPSGLRDDQIEEFAASVQSVVSKRVDDYWKAK